MQPWPEVITYYYYTNKRGAGLYGMKIIRNQQNYASMEHSNLKLIK